MCGEKKYVNEQAKLSEIKMVDLHVRVVHTFYKRE